MQVARQGPDLLALPRSHPRSFQRTNMQAMSTSCQRQAPAATVTCNSRRAAADAARSPFAGNQRCLLQPLARHRAVRSTLISAQAGRWAVVTSVSCVATTSSDAKPSVIAGRWSTLQHVCMQLMAGSMCFICRTRSLETCVYLCKQHHHFGHILRVASRPEELCDAQ